MSTPRARRSRSLVGSVVTAIVVLALDACALPPPVPYRGNRSGPTVAMMGDSIGWAIRDALHERLDPAYAVSVSLAIGPRIGQRMETAKAYAHAFPKVVVIELGQNDNSYHSTTKPPPSAAKVDATVAATAADLRAMLALFAPGTCIVLVNLNSHTAYIHINYWAHVWDTTAVPAVVAGDRRVRVVDWDGYVRAYHAAGMPEGPLFEDWLHPAGIGTTKMAALIGTGVDSCVAHPPA